MSPQYWLFKTEPACYSIDDLAKKRTDHWDGVRNYQARNFLRDDVKIGDLVFIYHSRVEPMAIAGLAEITREAYPDHTQYDPENDHFDPKSNPQNPRWFMVDVTFIRKFDEPLTLNQLRRIPELSNMRLLQKGQRLSIQPVTRTEAEILLALIQ
ncbi:MAG: EVE domain-containing protein [Candidatus Marinimicrobia bacterium CG1_02_48_14]|nr:MAG: EVE domain-containing protein [Candidatus Marinimicrobia bacterium CG1_02_48_14]PIZ63882.1 MAG: EVE domain-containing protein [Candidatus Marinimicrobia bacterium CG_4_10_14_0_2_um_filter_48_9]